MRKNVMVESKQSLYMCVRQSDETLNSESETRQIDDKQWNKRIKENTSDQYDKSQFGITQCPVSP